MERGLILAQQPVENKSNEITAIPKILEQINLQGAVITINAMGCQRDIAKKNCDGGADYVLALKGNSGRIHYEVIHYFKEAEEAGYEYLDFHRKGSGPWSHCSEDCEVCPGYRVAPSSA